eukprot:TRINITY_DN982_c0_g1_i2.p1 TRINITY_DN982_c0_g1~~TRINITY_DN982_c0_g1_i2.p1  ORF type:complete len:184 (+),score=34.21 TRINITY_DN982_c0_g1_i2:206-757(+)
MSQSYLICCRLVQILFASHDFMIYLHSEKTSFAYDKSNVMTRLTAIYACARRFSSVKSVNELQLWQRPSWSVRDAMAAALPAASTAQHAPLQSVEHPSSSSSTTAAKADVHRLLHFIAMIHTQQQQQQPTDDVERPTSAARHSLPERPDVAAPAADRPQLLSHAAVTHRSFYVVPLVKESPSS